MRTVGSFEFENGFILEANTFLADTEGLSKERRLSWYSDFANYVFVRYDQVVEQLVCICVVNEQWLFNETADVPAEEWNGSDQLWHKLSIELLGDHLMVFRDDILIFEHFDSAISQMPKIGHIHLSNTYQQTCFDDVMMTSISGPAYICGDANADQTVNVSDAVYIVNYVFIGGNAPDPLEAGDGNCDSTVNISDAVWIINYVFIGGNPPCDTNGDGTPDC
jgi:hypothetical protein